MLSAQTFTLTPPGLIEFGAGAVRRLPGAIRSLGKDRAFVVTDPGIEACGILARVAAVLDEAAVECAVFAGVGANPSTDTVDRAAAAARAFGDACVVALGGGSSLDAAKGVSLAATNPLTAAELARGAEPARPGLPLVAVPTTAGTGAETNGFGVFEDTVAHCKVYLGDASVTPRVSVLDPELTVGLPARVTAATGVDALVHGVESLTSRGRNPVSEAYAHQAVRLVHRWLPAAVADGDDLEARAQLLLGSHLGGLALSISGLGLVHGIAHAVTAFTGTPHGVALAAVFDRVLDFNRATSAAELAGVAVDLGVAQPGALASRGAPGGDAFADDPESAGSAAAAVRAARSLTERVGVFAPLSALGCTADLVPALARTALADPVTRNTPRMPTEEQLCDLLMDALD